MVHRPRSAVLPVILYKEQRTKLLDMADDIRAFIETNGASLKTKG